MLSRGVHVERLRTIAWALGSAWRIDKAMLVAVFAVAAALSVLPAVSLGFYKDIIAQISAFVAVGAGSFEEVLPALLAYAVLLALIGLSTRINTDFIAAIMDMRFTYGMQERLMEVINRFDVLELLRRNVNEDFNYIVRSSNALGKLVSGACSIAAKALTITTLCAVAWTMSRPVFFITLVYVALALLASLRFSKGTRFSYAKFRKAEVKAAYLQNMPMEANIAKEIRVYGCTEGVVESWKAAYSQRLGMELERFRATEVRTFALGASFYLFLAAVLAYLLVQVGAAGAGAAGLAGAAGAASADAAGLAGAAAGAASANPADLLTVFTLCANLFAAMGVLSRDLINFDENLFRIEQMRELLRGGAWSSLPDRKGERGVRGEDAPCVDGESDSQDAARSVGAVVGAVKTNGGAAAAAGVEAVENVGAFECDASGEDPSSPRAPVFSARNLSFSYDGKRRVLDNVSFDVNEGEVVALVGSNGSGKSTLVKLLIGVFAPDEGELFFRGRPYGECSPDYLSSQIGTFFQDFYLFHHSLAENIAYGAHERIGREDEVAEALEKGGAAHIAARLPEGARTLVGKRIDKEGAEFSGGEKQLLATARTYMGDKRVLIFDEPASMLDPLAELGQFEAIRNRIGGSTGVLISHRVGFARMADRVIMMEGGRVTETGTHDELMAKGGAYARFFREQAQWYGESGEGCGAGAPGGAGETCAAGAPGGACCASDEASASLPTRGEARP